MISIRNIFFCAAFINSLIAEEMTSGRCDWLYPYLTHVPNYPSKGSSYPWYAKLLRDPEGFKFAIETFAQRYQDYKLDAIVGLDAGGLVFASALAHKLQIPLVLVEKPGNLPRRTERNEFFEIEVESVQPGWIVLVVEDIISNGVKTKAACDLVESLSCMAVEVAALIEIQHLRARDLIDRPLFSLLSIP